MRKPDIPRAKREGLAVDLTRLERDGDGWLSAEDRYRLKTYGVCNQKQDRVFMVRIRVAGGRLAAAQARDLAALSRRVGRGWIHLTTRQNVELHHVLDVDVPDTLAAVEAAGLTTRSSCGHTVRNVMACAYAGTGLDEPFDVGPDAAATSSWLVGLSERLNHTLPGRVNISFGGCPECRRHALLNDIGFVSTIRDGEPGFAVVAGGSLGTSPDLAVPVADFIPRTEAPAMVEAVIRVYVAHGDLDAPARARLKHVVEVLGADRFREAVTDAFAAVRSEAAAPTLPPVGLLGESDRVAILARGTRWSAGVRPQRTPGLATVICRVPLGDLDADDLDVLAAVADRFGSGTLVLDRNQNVAVPDVPVGEVDEVEALLGTRLLDTDRPGQGIDVRACTGSTVCPLAISAAPEAGQAVIDGSRLLPRHPHVRIHVSGCPNSCAQTQAADLGFAGAKVKIAGVIDEGFIVHVGADLDSGLLAEPIGRIHARHVAAVTDAVLGSYEALAHPGEALGVTVRRLGLDAFAAQVASVVEGFETAEEEVAVA